MAVEVTDDLITAIWRMAAYQRPTGVVVALLNATLSNASTSRLSAPGKGCTRQTLMKILVPLACLPVRLLSPPQTEDDVIRDRVGGDRALDWLRVNTLY